MSGSKNIETQTGLVHAMRSNGPLHQVQYESYVKADEYSYGRLGQELLRLYFAQLVVCVHNELVKLLLATTTRVHASESRIGNLRI